MRFPTNCSVLSTVLLFLFMFVCANTSVAQQANPKHLHVQTIQNDDLTNVVCLVGTNDGKFVYSSGFAEGSLIGFSRNAETGELTQLNNIQRVEEDEEGEASEGAEADNENEADEEQGQGEADEAEDPANEGGGEIKGLVCIDLSQDQTLLVGCSLSEDSVTLFKRNVETGELAFLSALANKQIERGLGNPITVRFSPDARFVYVANANGGGTLTVLKIVEEQLELLQVHDGLPGMMRGCRMMCTDPTGINLYLGCDQAHTIVTFDRDEDEGHVRVLNVVEDDSEEASQLGGASGLSCSPDGKFLYVTSGRFRGDNAVSVFAIEDGGVPTLVQELVNEIDLENFTGGNHVAISPDGNFVYVSGATSKNVACFARNADDGTLEFVEYLNVKGNSAIGLVAGIYVSPDSNFVYVAGEGRKSIFVFQRQNVEEGN